MKWRRISLVNSVLVSSSLLLSGWNHLAAQGAEAKPPASTKRAAAAAAGRKTRPELEQVFIAMENGVKLQAVVATPRGNPPDGGYPLTIGTLGWGAYLKLEGSGGSSSAGYVSLTYMPRGQSKSRGFSTMMGEQEWKDMSAVISWAIANLPVNPDKIAVRGGSQGGVHSWMAAVHDPRVKTIIPSVSAINLPGSFFDIDHGAVRHMLPLVVRPTRARSNGFLENLWEAALDEKWEVLKPVFEQRRLTPEMIAGIKAPVFILHAWQDMVFPSDFEVEAFERLTVPKKLYIGVGGHRTPESTQEEETLRKQLQGRWLAYWLKGEQNGIMEEKPVTLMLSPAWERHDFDSFPKPAGTRQWYLHPDGTLGAQPDPAAKTITLRHEVKKAGLNLRQAVESQFTNITDAIPQSRLSFETSPFDEEVTVIGKPELHLSIKPSSKSYQVVALLKDIGPDGKPFLISRFSLASKDAEPGQAGKPVAIKSRLIGHKFYKGHKLKLEVMNYDVGEVNEQDMYVPLFEPYTVEMPLTGEGAASLVLPVGVRP